MQISPASTHSHQFRDPLFDDHTLTQLLTWQFVKSETPAISRLSLVHCSFKEKILSNGVDFCTWFVLKHFKKKTHRHINNNKNLIFTAGGLKTNENMI